MDRRIVCILFKFYVIWSFREEIDMCVVCECDGVGGFGGKSLVRERVVVVNRDLLIRFFLGIFLFSEMRVFFFFWNKEVVFYMRVL